MSNIKERILGAVTVMNDKDVEKVWDLIKSTFALSNAEEVEPDSKSYKNNIAGPLVKSRYPAIFNGDEGIRTHVPG